MDTSGVTSHMPLKLVGRMLSILFSHKEHPHHRLRRLRCANSKPMALAQSLLVGLPLDLLSFLRNSSDQVLNNLAFNLRFDRSLGTSFSEPTVTASPVQGSTESRATVSALSNQSYHWRARVLDGNGVPSSWVSFSGNSTDFAINASTAPLASFSWSPVLVLVGNQITFTAQAVNQPGLTFSWNFGDSATGIGGNPTHAYSQSGDYSVTLTVTDSQNHQTQQSFVVSVASTDLAGRINAAAGQSESMLDDILAKARPHCGSG